MTCRRLCLFLGAIALIARAGEADDHFHLVEPVVLESELSLTDLDAEAEARNPALQAARARWEAAKAEAPQAAAWENPRASLNFGHDLTQPENDTSVEWSLTQAVPWPGITSARLGEAGARAAAALAELRQGECEVRAELRAAAARLAAARAQLDLNARNRTLLRNVIEAVRIRYEAGQANEADVLMAEAELGRNDERRADLTRAYGDAQADLDTVLNRPPSAPFGRPPALDPSPPPPPSLETLQALAALHSPVLAAAASRRDAAQTRVGLARLDRRPRFEMMVNARQFNGPGPAFQAYGAGVAVELPWVNAGRYRAEVLEARKSVEAEEAGLRAEEAETAARVRGAWQDFATARHHAELYRGRLLPLARRAAEATRIAYEAGRGPFSDVLAALRSEQELESDLIGHLADCQLALASLIPLTGNTLAPLHSSQTP
jgi:outer membrane protein TolC